MNLENALGGGTEWLRVRAVKERITGGGKVMGALFLPNYYGTGIFYSNSSSIIILLCLDGESHGTHHDR